MASPVFFVSGSSSSSTFCRSGFGRPPPACQQTRGPDWRVGGRDDWPGPASDRATDRRVGLASCSASSEPRPSQVAAEQHAVNTRRRARVVAASSGSESTSARQRLGRIAAAEGFDQTRRQHGRVRSVIGRADCTSLRRRPGAIDQLLAAAIAALVTRLVVGQFVQERLRRSRPSIARTAVLPQAAASVIELRLRPGRQLGEQAASAPSRISGVRSPCLPFGQPLASAAITVSAVFGRHRRERRERATSIPLSGLAGPNAPRPRRRPQLPRAAVCDRQSLSTRTDRASPAALCQRRRAASGPSDWLDPAMRPR